MTLKVMTWNLENFFRPGVGDGPTIQAVYDRKLAGLAATINQEQPHALAVQELGDPDALTDLIDLLDGTWHRRVSEYDDPRHIRVAWISPLDIIASDDFRNFPAPLGAVQSDDTGGSTPNMGRGAVAITINSPDGTPVQLLTAHLKSKLLTFPGGRFNPHDEDERARFAAYALYRRAAEAATIRSWATAALGSPGQTAAVVVCGDLNDTVQAATTQILLGPPGSEIDTRGFKIHDKGDAERLWNLAPLMPAGRNYSRINQGRPELIDHILVSSALVTKVDITSVGAVIEQPLPSIAESPKDRKNAPSSDHAPVVATFNV